MKPAVSSKLRDSSRQPSFEDWSIGTQQTSNHIALDLLSHDCPPTTNPPISIFMGTPDSARLYSTQRLGVDWAAHTLGMSRRTALPRPRRHEISAEISSVARSISALDRALTRLAASLNGSPVRGASPRPRRHLTLSPARRAALKLQGKYMGYVRNLKPRQKAGVNAV